MVAIFLILILIVMTFGLFHTGMRHSRESEKIILATLAAENAVARVRSWAAVSSGTTLNFDDWTAIEGTTRDPNFSNFEVTVASQPYELFSPCSGFESAFAPPTRRSLQNSARLVEVTVTWDGGGVGRQVRMHTVVGSPARQLLAANPVDVNATGPNPVSRDQTVALTADLLDSTATPVPDTLFRWSVLPGTGNGRISTQTRPGSNSTFQHRIEISTTPPVILHSATNTYCSAEASTTYYGRTISGRARMDLID